MGQLDQTLFALEPQYRERVWGGQRLRPADPPVGEAWIAFGETAVADGAVKGRRLDELAAASGPELLGPSVVRRFGARFPLILKLLDCAEWLSVQVHPNDEQARRLVGPRENGKTEAWYFLESPAGGRILAGVKPGVTADSLATAIRAGKVLDVMADVPVAAGSSVLIPAGTLHSLGPGLFLYEIQQASDTTYRAYDWGRPQTPNRRLHIEESLEVARPVEVAERRRASVTSPAGAVETMSCEYFRTELARATSAEPFIGDTEGASFHALTTIAGSAEVIAGGDSVRLEPFQTALVSAAARGYRICSLGDEVTLLRSSVPLG
jgi:mannose-6-phosphate isomerase